MVGLLFRVWVYEPSALLPPRASLSSEPTISGRRSTRHELLPAPHEHTPGVLAIYTELPGTHCSSEGLEALPDHGVGEWLVYCVGVELVPDHLHVGVEPGSVHGDTYALAKDHGLHDVHPVVVHAG